MEQPPGQVCEGWFQCLALIPVVSAPKPLKVTYIFWTHFGATENHDAHRILESLLLPCFPPQFTAGLVWKSKGVDKTHLNVKNKKQNSSK